MQSTTTIINSKDVDDSELKFVDTEKLRHTIANQIMDGNGSISSFAKKIGLDTSILTRFLSGERTISKDYLIIIGIGLGYEINELNEFLKCFGAELHARNKRDYTIIKCVKKHMNLIDIEIELEDQSCDSLYRKPRKTKDEIEDTK